MHGLQIRAEPIFNNDFNLCVLESSEDFLISQDITLSERILDVGQQGVVLRHLDEVVGQHGLIEEVLGALDVVATLILHEARLHIRVDADSQVFPLLSVHSSRVNSIFKKFKAVIDRVECVVVRTRYISLESSLTQFVTRNCLLDGGRDLVVDQIGVDGHVLDFQVHNDVEA